MEQGSLLQEALLWSQQQDQQHEDSSSFLTIQVFCLPSFLPPPVAANEATTKTSMLSVLETLKESIAIGNHLNDEFQKIEYPWITGGDGPIWGFDIVHDDCHHPTNDSNRQTTATMIPCLTCTIRYGDSVQDEWQAIRTIFNCSKHLSPRALIRCIDSDDGQVLLIELADVLPDWVDDWHGRQTASYDNKNDMEFRCWIHQGKIFLIPPNPDDGSLLSLSQAMQRLQSNHQIVELASTSYVEQVLQSKIPEELYHRAAVVLPRSIAHLFEKRPDLIALSISKFMQKIIRSNKSQENDEDDDMTIVDTTSSIADRFWNDDWVWITLKFGRTSYAMLRNATSRNPGFEHPDQIPPQYRNRIPDNIQHDTESSSLYPYALPMGVRLVVGLQAAVAQRQVETPTVSTSDLGKTQWKRMLSQLQLNDPSIQEQFWQFPIWKETSKNDYITPSSDPESSLAEQVENVLKESSSSIGCNKPPSTDQVDSDSWMYLDANDDRPPDHSADKSNKNNNTQIFDDMVQGVQTFLSGQSSVLQGVVTSSERTTNPSITINPTIFLNLLHATLRAETPEKLQAQFEAAKDPYFSSEDYNFLDPDQGDSDEGEVDELEMRQVMDAMDEELQRDMATNTTSAEEKSQLLYNWLKSLEGGGAGPARNLLEELGVHPPNVLPEELCDKHDDDS